LLRFLLPKGAQHLEEEKNRRFFDLNVGLQHLEEEKNRRFFDLNVVLQHLEEEKNRRFFDLNVVLQHLEEAENQGFCEIRNGCTAPEDEKTPQVFFGRDYQEGSVAPAHRITRFFIS
jgi:hypothetical protein